LEEIATSALRLMLRNMLFFHCTVSVIVTCLLMGDVPEDVAVMVIMLEPTGVPGLWLVPPLLLALAPQAVHQIVERINIPTRPRRRMLPDTRLLFLFTKTNPKPGSNKA
jgi:hypothetical protein